MSVNRASLELADPDLIREAAYVDGCWLAGDAIIEVTNPADETLVGSADRQAAGLDPCVTGVR